MGAKTELFPAFAELCATARGVEKKQISIPLRPIDGKLVLDENSGIFPREFEDYTYRFLLFEAQKIERWLSTEAIISSQQEEPGPEPDLSPEKKMEEDLRKFVSAQEQAMPDDEKGGPLLPPKRKAAPEPEEKIVPWQGEEPEDIARAKEESGLPGAEEGIGAEQEAEPKREEIPVPPRAKPRVLPQKTPAAGQEKPPFLPSAPKIPIAKAAAPPMPSQPEKPVQSIASPEEQAPAADDGKKPPAGISSYSKLSPRLRALIEQKLRREDEKAKQAKQDSEIFKTPPVLPEEEEEPAPPSEPEEDGEGAAEKGGLEEEKEMPVEPIMRDEGEEKGARSGMEKTSRKLPLRRPSDIESEAPSPPDEGEEKEGMDKKSEEAAEEEQAPPPLKMAPRKPARGEESPAPPRKMVPSLPVRDEEEDEDEGPLPDEDADEKEQLEAPSPAEEEKQLPLPALEEKQAAAPRARDDAPLLIKQVFPDAAPKAKPSSPAEESDRMRRIQRIISDLSPDRARAQPKREEVSFEKEGEAPAEEEGPAQEEEPAQKEEEAPAPSKALGKKAKAAGAPLKKTAKAAKKKTLRKAKPAATPDKQLRAPPAQAPSAKTIPLRKAPVSPEEEEEQAPAQQPRKLTPRIPAREEEEEQAPAQQPRKLVPRMPIQKERQAPRKLTPRIPAREEEEEEVEGEEQAPADAQQPRKLVPRLSRREEEKEEVEEEEQPPAAAQRKPAPRKLISRIPAREEEEEEAQEPPARATHAKRRILPGMGRTQPPSPQTYVPPARGKKRFPLAREEAPDDVSDQESGQEDEAPEQGQAVRGQEEGAPDDVSDQESGQEEEALEPDREPEEEAPEPRKMSKHFAPLRPKKLASDEATPSEKTPEQLAQDRKMARMAEQLARLEAGRAKEVAGTAALPQDEEDVPLPPEEDASPKPPDYEQAKESLRRSLEHDETARKVKQGEEATVEQYAKDHLVWLYEIYKMGGMGREDFLKKAAEKYSEAQGESQAAAPQADGEAPPNPALANLTKVIEKKDKK